MRRRSRRHAPRLLLPSALPLPEEHAHEPPHPSDREQFRGRSHPADRRSGVWLRGASGRLTRPLAPTLRKATLPTQGARQAQIMQKSARLLGWLLLAALAFVTVCPISLRPISNEPLWFERSVPYALFALLFSIGFPRHRVMVLVLTIAAAGALEAAQILQPSRHGRLPDFLIKAAGCAFGWLVSQALLGLYRARERWAPRF